MSPTHPPLAPADVHLWRLPLDLPDSSLAALNAGLSRDETRWAAQFATALDRRRAVARWGWRRSILGRYLGLDPGLLEFRFGPRGKPELAQPACELHFNASQAGGHGLLAVALGRPIGVDLEAVRPVEGLAGLIDRFLPPEARDALAGLAGSVLLETFFRSWTRHEAWVKAQGAGLSDMEDPSTIGADSDWSVMDLATPPGWAAALAARGTIARVLDLDARGLELEAGIPEDAVRLALPARGGSVMKSGPHAIPPIDRAPMSQPTGQGGPMSGYDKTQAADEFTRWSESYDRSVLQTLLFAPSHDALIRRLRGHLGDRPARILDVGCGTGLFAARVREALPMAKLYGVDLTAGMLAKGRDRWRKLAESARPVQGDSERLPFESGSFDAISCANSFHHYPRQDRAIAEMRRVLAPGGRLLLIDGYRDAPYGWFIYDVCVAIREGQVHHCSRRRVRTLMQAGGFVDIRQDIRRGFAPFLLTEALAPASVPTPHYSRGIRLPERAGALS